MFRFSWSCNKKYLRNDTEATDHYFHGFSETLDTDLCYTNAVNCTEYKYSELGMGLEGVTG